MRSEESIGRDAARQGMGVPVNASPAAQQAYHRELSRMHRPLLPGFSIPRPQMDAEALGCFLIVPAYVAYWLLMDLARGWRWWRVLGVLAGIGVAAAAMAGGLHAEFHGSGVLADLAARFGVDVETMAVNIGAGGLSCVVVFLFPRTIVLVVLLGAAAWAYRHWVAPWLA